MMNHVGRIDIPKSVVRGVMCSQEQQPGKKNFHYTKLPKIPVSLLAQQSLDNADL